MAITQLSPLLTEAAVQGHRMYHSRDGIHLVGGRKQRVVLGDKRTSLDKMCDSHVLFLPPHSQCTPVDFYGLLHAC